MAESHLIESPIRWEFRSEMWPEHERLAEWRAHLNPVVDVIVPDGPGSPPFFGQTVSYLSPWLMVTRVTMSPQQFVRDRMKCRRSADHFMIVHCFSGGATALAGDRSVTLQAGDTALADLSRPFSTRFDACSMLMLFLPRQLVVPFMPAADVHGTVITKDRPTGQLLAACLTSLLEVLPTAGNAEVFGLSKSIAASIGGSLFGVVEAAQQNETQQAQALLERAMAYIDANIGVQTLGPDTLCRELRVSRAHLYRAFASRGGVSQVIMLRRLEHAFAALRSPDTAARSIGSIAYAAGFANESHFSRVFRAHYGMSPSKVREAAPRLPGSSGEHPMHQWLLEAWGAR
ncbi:helix-turn-helix domain-containing protein [uncultured Ferrovibrio sp.]|jgi:AraC-type DNA-binding domain-containing proteins|uniref:helix-turn-helix domain-containing protein n=1 Tax=uncultured Ferrovibrio sp. TaxID=1576913 RepID=UPI00260768F2|nr:helix-turn-helix domain-containing protein [uncultured Ferrovibrio sp.]